jgi:hypothetical protein
MKTTVFAKRIKSHDGKSFTIFVTNLERKDGTQQYMKLMYTGKDKNKRFDSDACPMVIEFDRQSANVSTTTYTDKNGEERKSYTLWLKDYRRLNEQFVDHSLDDFI